MQDVMIAQIPCAMAISANSLSQKTHYLGNRVGAMVNVNESGCGELMDE